MDVFVSTSAQKRTAIQSVKMLSHLDLFLSEKAWVYVCGKAVKKVVMDFLFCFVFVKVTILLMLPFQKPLEDIQFSIPITYSVQNHSGLTPPTSPKLSVTAERSATIYQELT